MSIFVLGGMVIGPQFHLINHPKEFLVVLGDASEPFPAWFIKEPVFFHIKCAGDGVIGGDHSEGFQGDLPIFPLDHDIVTGALPVVMTPGKWSLMCDDFLVLPHHGFLMVSLNVVHNLTKGEDLFELMVIHGAPEL